MASTHPVHPTKKEFRKIVAFSSVGTLIEWYDFFIYGSLATVIAGQFYPQSNPTAALLYTLATFAAGFLVRPFGARVFGFGRAGRKYAFLLPLFLMGGSTFAIGLIPGYAKIGLAAPMIVLLLRLLQGLALGSSAPYDPGHSRGLYTSWTQAAASLGLLLSLAVILLVRRGLDADTSRSIAKFNDWGWRIPFLVSGALMVIAVKFRTKSQEWPVSPAMPARDGAKADWKLVLLAVFGATMGQGVVFYTGQLYIQPFLETVCQIDFDQSRTMLLLATLVATPFFILFGSWSDRIGRKWIIMTGLLLAAVSYPFLFQALKTIPDTAGRTELVAEKEIRSTVTFIENSKDLIHISNTVNHYEGGLIVTQTEKDTLFGGSKAPMTRPVVTISRKIGGADYWKITGILFLMVFYATMIGGPMAAFLAELVPGGTALPSAIGDGIGGITPFIATLLTTLCAGHALAGLWYPVGVAAVCLIVGILFLPARRADAGKA
ncbi:MFS transporter [Puia sp.]|uniref:MFS transporter n=1 Tax=Puia sp. TaxID=2045100 RepID=UPI002F420C81